MPFRLQEDIRAIKSKDPAARSAIEVMFCYPGLHALWFHRRSHWLWEHRLKFFARFLSHISRFFTGIEIHPGAKIGHRAVIDHGMGVVIGETAEVGNDVLIYMGVVLGGTALENVKRHPTVEDDVVIGSGASVLGPITLGKGSKVGAGAVVIRSVPAGATVVGVPGRIAGPEGSTESGNGDPESMPDPMLRVISRLLDRQSQLEDRILSMEKAFLSGENPEISSEMVCKNEILEALKEVIDPEVGIDIVDLGLIKEIRVQGDEAIIDMILTCKTCPLVNYLKSQVERKALGICGINSVLVNILDEPWNWDRFVRQEGNLKKI
ncbi:serine O-acetyltransferase [Methanoplanus limicola]|uniref:Serine acetyltransferase n=1 Tax=Methanoplanus limicola DSM 2279 TaxID=937775 RepID=H1Z2R8_9EURY|nr:serine O-acetyltransferase [Methanoplanus limicola]EHQ36471.1 serine O-acetyltransferase [Methanoplanus limicola DSM 2279]